MKVFLSTVFFKIILLLAAMISISGYCKIPPSFDGAWLGTFLAVVAGQGCHYNMRLTISKSTVHWQGNRTRCSVFACDSCPKITDFTNPIIRKKLSSIVFSSKANNNQDELIILRMDESGNKLLGTGHMKRYDAAYNMSLNRQGVISENFRRYPVY